jgi:hypothetical protein
MKPVCFKVIAIIAAAMGAVFLGPQPTGPSLQQIISFNFLSLKI